LEWFNQGRVFIYNNINYTYWHSQDIFVATMTGVQYNTFMTDYVGKFNETLPFYDAWNVFIDFPNTPLIEGYTCFSFVFSAVQEIVKMGGKMQPGVDSLKVSLGTLYTSHNVTKVSYSDPAWTNQILDFYLTLDESVQILGYAGFLEEIVAIITTGDFFVRNRDDYYFVQLTYPYFLMHWTDFPLFPKRNKLHRNQVKKPRLLNRK